jgi:protoporphyrinogen oxidase
MEENYYEVIVVGAGMAGIGASRILTEHQVPHLVLESRDRIGGRVYSQPFAGSLVELGASFVHSPEHPSNMIARYIEKNNINTIDTHDDKNDLYYYEGQGHLTDHNLISKVIKLESQLVNCIEDACEEDEETDRPLAVAI